MTESKLFWIEKTATDVEAADTTATLMVRTTIQHTCPVVYTLATMLVTMPVADQDCIEIGIAGDGISVQIGTAAVFLPLDVTISKTAFQAC